MRSLRSKKDEDFSETIPKVESGNKEELLLKLKNLDPQYEINLEKYKHLTNEDLQSEIIALEKSDISY